MTPAGDADVGKGARAASGGAVAIRAEDSLSALSALLGEDEVEARRRREMDEADARRAEAQAEERKEKRRERVDSARSPSRTRRRRAYRGYRRCFWTCRWG